MSACRTGFRLRRKPRTARSISTGELTRLEQAILGLAFALTCAFLFATYMGAH